MRILLLTCILAFIAVAVQSLAAERVVVVPLGKTFKAGVPKTGQSKCYESVPPPTVEVDCAGTGQDGELQKGVAPPEHRFTDNGDGTVTDNFTGLIWLKNANCIGTDNPGMMTTPRPAWAM